VADEANAEKCANGHVLHVHSWICRAEENPVTHFHFACAKGEGLLADSGLSARTNLHENRPRPRFAAKRRFFATYNVAGVRVFDIKDAFAQGNRLLGAFRRPKS